MEEVLNEEWGLEVWVEGCRGGSVGQKRRLLSFVCGGWWTVGQNEAEPSAGGPERGSRTVLNPLCGEAGRVA